MTRTLLAAAAVACPAPAPAQPAAADGRAVPVRPVMTTADPRYVAGYVGAVAGGGPDAPYVDLGTGVVGYPAAYYAAPWPGGFVTPRGLYVPYGVTLGFLPVDPPAPPPARPAVLTVRYPGPAAVQADGPAAVADPADGSAWVFASPPLRAGERYTFRLRAEWSAGGTAYTHERVVTVAAGDQSRLQVFAGTPAPAAPGASGRR